MKEKMLTVKHDRFDFFTGGKFVCRTMMNHENSQNRVVSQQKNHNSFFFSFLYCSCLSHHTNVLPH
jgi:hypothetical protein